MKPKARVIAIYLPQYHPIPENDAVWGKGFTEWTNVAQAVPLFRGHYQPRVPRDFGFYDLRMPEVREMQAEYARKAGIEGFMYWQYYFGDGKMLLEKPFEDVLRSGKPDFPFCLGWANHSWQTWSWDRLERGDTMIMEQKYAGEKQYEEHFLYNLPAFQDPRYIKVNGKPIFVIWNPSDHKEQISLLIKTWRKLAEKYGLKGIHFVGQQEMVITEEQLMSMGFDAIYQNRAFAAQEAYRGYYMWRIHNTLSSIKFFHILKKYDFGKLSKSLVTDDVKKDNVYPTLIAGYDRSPRAGRKAVIYHNFTPETWRNHIKQVLELIKDKKRESNIVILKSWNEWGESNYLEPDIKYGTAMLDVLGEEILEKK